MKLRAVLALALFALLLGGCAAREEPQPPTGLAAAVQADSAVLLTWEPSPEGEAYRIYRRAGTETDFKFQDDVTDCRYTDPFARKGQTYLYKVAVLSGTKEYDSTQVEIAVPADGSAVQSVLPEAPVIDSVTVMGDGTAVIRLEGDTAQEYRFFRSDSPQGEYTLLGTSADPIYYDGTAAGIQYYRARAVSDGLIGPDSQPVATGTNAQQVFGVPVLMYHEFVTASDLEAGVLFDEYAVWADEFESDLIWLRQHGYTTVNTADLLRYMNGEEQPPEKPVILTIDDGKWGVYRNAWPLLKQYDMKAVLSVIGTEISGADPEAQVRAHQEAPYCTWEELREMSDSGHVEIISHTYGMHIYNYKEFPGRVGADCAPEETEEDFRMNAYSDYLRVERIFRSDLDRALTAMSYPYSKRSVTADKVWLECGYQVLYSGNTEADRPTRTNYFVAGAGVNRWSAVVRRVARMTGSPMMDYLS